MAGISKVGTYAAFQLWTPTYFTNFLEFSRFAFSKCVLSGFVRIQSVQLIEEHFTLIEHIEEIEESF